MSPRRIDRRARTSPRASKDPLLSAHTVESFLRWWLRDVVPLRVRTTTWAHYDTVVRRRLIPAFGSTALTGLEAEAIQASLAEESRTGRAVRSVRQTLRVLRIALECAVELGLVDTNVARRVATPRVERGVILPFSPTEVRRLLRAAEGRPIELALALGLAGLRAGEVRGLQWGDLDLRRRLVHIRRTAQWAGSGLEVVPPKTPASVRTVKLPAFAMAALRQVPRGSRSGYVYAGPRGTPLHGTVIGRWLAEVAAAARVDGLTMHRLRHTAAAMMLESAVHLRVVMTVLGHARVQKTLDPYGHLRPELHRDAAVAMDAWVRRQR